MDIKLIMMMNDAEKSYCVAIKLNFKFDSFLFKIYHYILYSIYV